MNEKLIDYQQMGERIKAARRERKMTQKELADRTELCASYICHIERGVKHSSIESIAAICRALKMDANYLLFGEHWTG